MKKIIRLATRASQLALVQAEIVKSNLLEQFDNNITVELVPIITQGDRDLTSPLYKIGGKGVFIKEIEYALLEDKADIAVHSLKDITTTLADGLQLSGFLAAEGVRDVLLFKNKQTSFVDLPKNSTIATGSLRRQALIKYFRPDISVTQIRGNVLTRLEKLKTLDVCGMILSEAGLIRLNIQDLPMEYLKTDTFIPAPGQGVIALETRSSDPFFTECCQKITDDEQEIKSTTELQFLEGVGLNCKEPLGLHAKLYNKQMEMTLFLANQSMTEFLIKTMNFAADERFKQTETLIQTALNWLKQHDTPIQ